MRTLNRFFLHPWAFPLLLMGIMAAAFALQINRLGFYWDDWMLVFLARLKDRGLFWGYYAFDRPLAAWTYLLTVPALGTHPLAWQIYTLLMRWLGALGSWWGLRGLWPRREAEAGWITLLLAVYPGFSQQPIAITYSLFFTLYACFTFSLALMIRAQKDPKRLRLFTTLAVALTLVQLLSMEYVAGLELLRPLFLWFLLRAPGERTAQTLGRVLKRWLPYLAALVAFVLYRFVFFAGSAADPEANSPTLLLAILKNPFSGLVTLTQNMAQDFIHAALFTWGAAIQPQMIDFALRTNWFSWLIGAACAGAAFAYFHFTSPGEDETSRDDFVPQAMLVGVVGFALGGLPVWSTGRQIITGMWSDRFTLGPMLGAAVLLAGTAAWLSAKKTPRFTILAVFLALAVAAQVQSTFKYALNWQAQKDYYWQLAWRAPGLKPGTAVLGTKIPFGLVGEYSVGFALNSIYAPGLNTTTVPYWFYSAVSDRGGSIVDFRDGVPLKYRLRTIAFDGNTTQGLAVMYKYGLSCLRVMTRDDAAYPGLSDDESELTAISHPGQIMDEADKGAAPPAEVFGKEPEHDWCYYFQKADLARQNEQWDKVLDLDRQAAGLGLKPANGSEWSPFVEALVRKSQWEDAANRTLDAVQLTGSMKKYYCAEWERLLATSGASPAREAASQQVTTALECSPGK